MEHDRKLLRCNGRNYARNGHYFVTICTYDRIKWFGKINNGLLNISTPGRIVMEQWKWLAERYDHVILDEFIIMPDHIHAIIEINRDNVGDGRDHVVRNGDFVGNGRDHAVRDGDFVGNGRDNAVRDGDFVGNGRDRSLHDQTHSTLLPVNNKIKPLPDLIGAFKTTSSKLIHSVGFKQFKWQKSFHDRIIRDDQSLDVIRKYIRENPGIL